MAQPQPPTRITVSGGPKAEPHLSHVDPSRTIDRPLRDPYRMAHRSVRLTIRRWLGR